MMKLQQIWIDFQSFLIVFNWVQLTMSGNVQEPIIEFQLINWNRTIILLYPKILRRSYVCNENNCQVSKNKICHNYFFSWRTSAPQAPKILIRNIGVDISLVSLLLFPFIFLITRFSAKNPFNYKIFEFDPCTPRGGIG